MTKDQFESITEWQKAIFPQATALSKVIHLKQEVKELKIDLLDRKNKDPRHEFADCFILLFGAAGIDGMTYEDICAAIDEKMEINRNRKWGEPDKDGVVNHTK